MFSYTTKNINIISLVVSIIIFISINQIISIIGQVDFSKPRIEEQKVEENIEKNVEDNTEIGKIGNDLITVPEAVVKKNIIWKIEIPSISLKADISEGTTKEVMDKFVGHFTNTSKKKGNIGLAAHNRGYSVNYFQNLKKLKKGDEIIYQYDKFKKIYIVDKILIINDTDWEKLENTDDNIITLITCVENEPLYRRCIQGIEKE